MDELDELPTWAARTHVPGTNLPMEQPREPKRRSFRVLIFAALGVIALGAIAGLGYVAANSIGGDGNETESDGGAALSSEDGAEASADGDAAEEGATADGSSADGESSETEAGSADGDTDATDGDADDGTNPGAAGGDTADGDDAGGEGGSENVTGLRGGEVVDNANGEIRYAVLTGGQLFLRGRVHSEEYGQAVEDVATAVMGPGNVINEYEIDPSTPDVIDAPIYVEDVVLFEFNSIEVAPPFLPILDLGTLLMTQNPSVTMTVISRTDSVGSDSVNMEVAQLRGQAVVNYWQRQGIDPSRITIVPKGEEEASDNEAEAALDRRAEFVIQNLFG